MLNRVTLVCGRVCVHLRNGRAEDKLGGKCCVGGIRVLKRRRRDAKQVSMIICVSRATGDRIVLDL